MPDERRDSQRLHVAGVKVVFESATGERVETDAVDLSPGGVFIRTTGPLTVGKRISLEFVVVGEPVPWPAIGRVVWARTEDEGTDKPAGMGVKLIGTDDVVATALAQMLDTREPTSPGVGSTPPPPIASPISTAGALSFPSASVREREPTLVGVGSPSDPPPPPAKPPSDDPPRAQPSPEAAPAEALLPPPLAHMPAKRGGGARRVVLLLLIALAIVGAYVVLDGFLRPMT